jgi:predicted aspartyl protease
MGHVRAKALFCNAVDYVGWLKGELPEADVRRVEVDALVDTGATYPALPKDLIELLGLVELYEAEGEVANGAAKLKLLGPAIIKVEDRMASSPVIERPEGTTPLIGVVALEQMGFRVDPVSGRLIKGLPFML